MDKEKDKRQEQDQPSEEPVAEEQDLPSDMEPETFVVPATDQERVSLERVEEERAKQDLEQEQVYDTQHSDGHTYNPHLAQEQGLTYTPPTDPPVVPDHDDPQGAEVATGFATAMENVDPDVEDLPASVDNNDLEVEEDVRTALRYNSETTNLENIQVQARDGIVTLTGTVPTDDDLALVYAIVSELEGVVVVRNRIEIEI
jgi:osmotically-inducible protein OsmY